MDRDEVVRLWGEFTSLKDETVKTKLFVVFLDLIEKYRVETKGKGIGEIREEIKVLQEMMKKPLSSLVRDSGEQKLLPAPTTPEIPSFTNVREYMEEQRELGKLREYPRYFPYRPRLSGEEPFGELEG